LPDLPESHGIFVLLLTGFALYLFTRDRLPKELWAFRLLLSPEAAASAVAL